MERLGHLLEPTSATLYPRDPLLPACPFNDRVVVLVGPNLATTVPVVLPDNKFQKRAATACHTTAYLIGPQGRGAGPPAVLRTGPHVVGDADTDAREERHMIILPTEWSQRAVENAPAGSYTLNRNGIHRPYN